MAIEDRERAEKLAHAILAGIGRAHDEKIRAGTLEARVMDEGRRLYRSRVAPSLHDEFERVLDDFAATHGIANVPRTLDATSAARPVHGASRVDRFASTSVDADDRGSGATGIVVGLVLLVVALGATAAILILR